MKNNKKRIEFTVMMALGIMIFCTISASAAPSSTSVPQLIYLLEMEVAHRRIMYRVLKY